MKELGFLKAHRLSSKLEIEQLIAEGNSVTEFPLRFISRAIPSTEFSIKVAISIPKKRFAHAVDRNKLKRRVREAFRKHYASFEQSPFVQLHVLIIYIDSKAYDFETIETAFEKGLHKVLSKI